MTRSYDDRLFVDRLTDALFRAPANVKSLTVWSWRRLQRFVAYRRLRRKSPGVLGQLLRLSPAERHTRVSHPDIKDALQKLEKHDAIEWLEFVLESPVTSHWGQLLYSLDPAWGDLDRWVRLSKEHCLAAIDALLSFAPSEFYYDDRPARFPHDADAANINRLIDDALERYDNFRLRDAAKRIRHTWPLDGPLRHEVVVPDALGQAARLLFQSSAQLMKQWIDGLETGLDPPDSDLDFWNSLMVFCDRHDCVAVADHRADPRDFAGRLRQIRIPLTAQILWSRYEQFDGDLEELFAAIGAELSGTGFTLTDLEEGEGHWTMTILPDCSMRKFESLASGSLSDLVSLRRY